MIGPYGMGMGKQPELSNVSPRLKMLLSQEPAIPRAIPAPSSPLKPLDRALENQRGETNVYIRGLLPETTDEVLEGWGSRFGDIKSSKSIIDMNTGLCKGFVLAERWISMDSADSLPGSASSSTTTMRMPRTAFVASTSLAMRSASPG